MRQPLVVLIGRTLLMDGIAAYLEQTENVRIREERYVSAFEQDCIANDESLLIIMDNAAVDIGEVFPILLKSPFSCLVSVDSLEERAFFVHSQYLSGIGMSELCDIATHYVWEATGARGDGMPTSLHKG